MIFISIPEVESRTWRLRPRTQRQSETKDRLFEDRLSPGQEQEWSRPSQGHNFSKLRSANLTLFLRAQVFRILHFMKFLMIIRK